VFSFRIAIRYTASGFIIYLALVTTACKSTKDQEIVRSSPFLFAKKKCIFTIRGFQQMIVALLHFQEPSCMARILKTLETNTPHTTHQDLTKKPKSFHEIKEAHNCAFAPPMK
jgi:hypothetical protein